MHLCFVVQRYGEQIAGGAESHCRQIAERLAKIEGLSVSVVTTCATNYQTWANTIPEGDEWLNGVRVHRFPVDYTRPTRLFDTCYEFLVSFQLWLSESTSLVYPKGTDLLFENLKNRLIKKANVLHPLLLAFLLKCTQFFWMRLQGPISSKMQKFLKHNSNQYDAFIFFTYTYATCYYGIPNVKKARKPKKPKCILVPTAHNDPCLSFALFDKMYSLTDHFIFQTPEERDLIFSRFPRAKDKPHSLCAIGIDAPKIEGMKAGSHFPQLGNHPFLLYVGRIESSKGCTDLISYFLSVKTKGLFPGGKLVLAGQALMPIPEHPDILPLGFVTDTEKWALMRDTLILVMPSPFESLSIVCLEAWSMGTPVLANAACDVLKGQVTRSQGGLLYKNSEEFSDQLEKMGTQKELRQELSQRGMAFVKEHYQWDQVIQTYRNVTRST